MLVSETPDKLLKFGKMAELFAYLEKQSLDSETKDLIVLQESAWNDMLQSEKRGVISFEQKQLIKSKVRSVLSDIIKELP